MVYDHNTSKFRDEFFLPFPFMSELHKETDTCPPKSLIEPEDYSLSPSLSPITLHYITLYYITLHYINHSLILIVFSSFAKLLKIL